MAALLLLVAFTLGFSFGYGNTNDIGAPADSLSSWVTSLATTVIALLTIVLAWETWQLRRVQMGEIERLRRASIRPSVSLALETARIGINFLDVHVVNNGAGTARDISFQFRNSNPDAADVYEAVQARFAKIAIFNEGLASLAPGRSTKSWLLSFIELSAEFPERALTYAAEVEITYKDIEGHTFSTTVVLRFLEYEGMTELGGDPMVKLADQLEKLQKSVSGVISGRRRVRTEPYDREDRETERENLQRQIELQRSKRSEPSTEAPPPKGSRSREN